MVQHDDLTGPQDRAEHLLDGGGEGVGSEGTEATKGRLQASGREGGDSRGGGAVVAGDAADGPLPARCPSVQPRQPHRRAGLVHEDQALCWYRGNVRSPRGSRYRILFACLERLFFRVQPRRARARCIAVMLTRIPCSRSHRAHCSASVASRSAAT